MSILPRLPQLMTVSSASKAAIPMTITLIIRIVPPQVYGLIHNKSEDKDAVQEKEGIHSKILSMYDKVQQKIVNLLNVNYTEYDHGNVMLNTNIFFFLNYSLELS